MGKIKYGLPYMGSKSKFAEDIISHLPSAETFVDLFAGGCAITHAALRSGKYRTVVANDINGKMLRLFADALAGRLDGREREWVSREEFFDRNSEDAYVAVVWSFGNNGRDYIYGRAKEAAKHALHDAIVFGDFDGIRREYGRKIANIAADALNTLETLHDRRVALQKLIAAGIGNRAEAQHLESAERINNIACEYRAQHLERAEHIADIAEVEHLSRAERIADIAGVASRTRLITASKDYRDAAADFAGDSAVIYCDPPYMGTGGYGIDFDFEKFRNWAAEYPRPLFISEYQMPTDAFVSVWEKDTRVTFAAQTNSLRRTERLFTQKRFAPTAATQLALFTEAELSSSVPNFA